MITEKAEDRGSQRCMHLYLHYCLQMRLVCILLAVCYADCFRLSELDYVNFKIKR